MHSYRIVQKIVRRQKRWRNFERLTKTKNLILIKMTKMFFFFFHVETSRLRRTQPGARRGRLVYRHLRASRTANSGSSSSPAGEGNRARKRREARERFFFLLFPLVLSIFFFTYPLEKRSVVAGTTGKRWVARLAPPPRLPCLPL